MKKIDIKFLLSSDMESILKKYTDKNILYNFLLYIVKDSKQYYDIIKYKDVLKAQDRVIELLGDLLLGKEVSKEQLSAAANAAIAASYAAANASANAAYAAANAANASANAANAAVYAANASANAANAAYAAANASVYAAYAAAYAASYAANAAAKQKEYRNYLIELVLEESKIDTKTYKLLYKEKSV